VSLLDWFNAERAKDLLTFLIVFTVMAGLEHYWVRRP
jgi:hypothetical protein